MAAITIISIGMLGVSSLVIQNLQVQRVNKNQLIASMLAQEGLELVRNIRDENWLKGDDWDLDILNAVNGDDGTFIVDYNAVPDDAPDDFTHASTELDINGNGFYFHGVGSPTIFKRLITATNPTGDYIEVESYVEWQDQGKTQSYIANSRLADWR